MRQTISLLFVCFWISLQAANLYFDSNSTVPVIHSDNATQAELTACAELSEYLAKLTNGIFPIQSENDSFDADAQAIYVGDTRFARRNQLDCHDLDREEWLIRSIGNKLILAGGRPRGTYYAVLEFLEKQGIVWPDETTEYVPAPHSIAITDLSLQGKPAIAYRRITLGMSTFNATTRHFLAHARRNDLALPEDYGGGEDMSGCHTFHSFTSPDWPDEYFSLSSGKRLRSVDGGGPGQLCMSNKDMQKAVLAKLREQIAKDRSTLPPERWPRIYDISQNDNEAACTCPTCLSLLEKEGAYSGVLLDFINFVANGIADEYPDVLIQTFAYCHTLKPPKHIRPAKNVLMRVCKMGVEFSAGDADTLTPVTHSFNYGFSKTLARWSEISEHLSLWDYWILYDKDSLPYVNVRALHDDIRTYKAHKVNNMLVECENPEDTSFSAFKQWLGYQQMVHPEYSLEDQTDKFFNAYYGKAAPFMKEYLHYLEKRMDELQQPLAKAGVLAVPYLDREFFETANALFDKAEQAAVNDLQSLQHIGYERVPVDASLLNMHAKFGHALPSGGLTAQELFERYKTNLLAHVSYYYKEGQAYDVKPGIYEKCAARLNAQKQIYFGKDLQIPEEYQKRLVCDINWSYGNVDRLVAMKDGFAGKALRVPDGENYYRLPLNLGIYNNGTAKGIATLDLQQSQIAQDETFHFYSFGRQTIAPQMICWIHWSWLVSLKLDYAFQPDSENTYEILVSMKVTGEPFVKGSKSEPGIYVDRILILK